MQIRGDYSSLTEPLFIFRDGSPVRPQHARSVLKMALKNLQLDPSLYNTHSFRIGRATDLFKKGFSLEQIKQYGRWKSNAIYKYLR